MPQWWGSLDPASLHSGTRVYHSGIAGWRWIFLLYGIATYIIGGVAWFFMLDFPEKLADGTQQGSTFLSREEAVWCIERIEKDRLDVILTE